MPKSAKLRVRLTPRGGRNALVKYEDGVLYARVSSPPVDGAANKALIELISDALGVAKSQVSIAAGSHGREKTLLIGGMDNEELVSLVESLPA